MKVPTAIAAALGAALAAARLRPRQKGSLQGPAAKLRELMTSGDSDHVRQGLEIWASIDRKLGVFEGELEEQERTVRGLKGVGIDLRGFNLSRVILDDFRIYNSDLHGIDLWGATLRDGTIQDTDCSKANLRYARLENAVLWRCNFDGAQFEATEFEGCDLTGSDFRKALQMDPAFLTDAASWDYLRGNYWQEAKWTPKFLEKLGDRQLAIDEWASREQG